MDEETGRALDQLISYVISDEAKHFHGQGDHIYRAIYKLAKWRGRDLSKYPDPDGSSVYKLR